MSVCLCRCMRACMLSCLAVSNYLQPEDCSLRGSSVHGNSPGDLPNPGVITASPVPPALEVDSLPLSHLGNTHTHTRIV